MPTTADELIKRLEQNGYEYVSSNGSHRKYRHRVTGRTVIIPYHRGDMKQGTVRSVLKQAGLL